MKFSLFVGGGERGGWIGYSLKPIGSWYMQVVNIPLGGYTYQAPNYLPSKLIPKMGEFGCQFSLENSIPKDTI